MDDKRIFNEDEEEVLTIQMRWEWLMDELKQINMKITEFVQWSNELSLMPDEKSQIERQ